MVVKQVYGKRARKNVGGGGGAFFGGEEDEADHLCCGGGGSGRAGSGAGAKELPSRGRSTEVDSLAEGLKGLTVKDKDGDVKARRREPLRARSENERVRVSRREKEEKEDRKERRKEEGEMLWERRTLKEVAIPAVSTRVERSEDAQPARSASRTAVTPAPSSTETRRQKPSSRSRRGESSSSPQEPVETAAEDPLTSYVRPLLRLSGRGSAAAITDFDAWAAQLDPHFAVSKIAEASYGEVYRLSLRAAKPGFTRADESVLKLIALKPPPTVSNGPNADEQDDDEDDDEDVEDPHAWKSPVDAVAGEVRLLRHLSPIPGFTNFRGVTVLRGRPGGSFTKAWRAWNRSRARAEKSMFPDPARVSSYGPAQLWAAVEMQDAGLDLEHLVPRLPRDVWTVWDLFWGVALAVAKAEEGCRFEHRDLHLGNVCVRVRARKGLAGGAGVLGLDDPAAAVVVRDVAGRKLGFTGLETTIIDYTLSRADLGRKEEDVAWLDLEQDPAVFEGDGAVEYQYDVYRYMRKAFFSGDPVAPEEEEDSQSTTKKNNKKKKSWKAFEPLTNLVWLHFILHELLKDFVWPPSEGAEEAGMARHLQHLGPDEDPRLARRKVRRLAKALRRLQALLALDNLRRCGLKGARDLVVEALVRGWLDEGDVVGEEDEEEEDEEGEESGGLLEGTKALSLSVSSSS